MSVESVAYNSCCLSKRLLQQCGEDVCSAKTIIGSLGAKVIDLKEKCTCMTRGDKTFIDFGCGKCLRGALLSLPALCLPHRQCE